MGLSRRDTARTVKKITKLKAKGISQVTAAEFKRMTPAQKAAAAKAGRLTALAAARRRQSGTGSGR